MRGAGKGDSEEGKKGSMISNFKLSFRAAGDSEGRPIFFFAAMTFVYCIYAGKEEVRVGSIKVSLSLLPKKRGKLTSSRSAFALSLVLLVLLRLVFFSVSVFFYCMDEDSAENVKDSFVLFLLLYIHAGPPTDTDEEEDA